MFEAIGPRGKNKLHRLIGLGYGAESGKPLSGALFAEVESANHYEIVGRLS